MKFTATNPTLDYATQRFVSENGVWEMGVYPVLFGYRVAANPVGAGGYEINYCAGKDPAHVREIRDLVREILGAFPEDVRPSLLRTLLPDYKVRPIHRDATCVPELRKMAELAREGRL